MFTDSIFPTPAPCVREHHADTPDGWSLHLRSTRDREHFDPTAPPLLILPGYGMNSFIFSYHPRGTSLERTLAAAGFDVWAVDLRGQGKSTRRVAGAPAASLQRYADVDLPVAIDHVLAHRSPRARDLTLIGCSLGGSLAYAYLARRPDPRVGRLVTMGAPLRWTEVHPILRLAFSSPTLAGWVRVPRTRALVRHAFPLLTKWPALLSLYMNPATIDTSRIDAMVRTVEDPEPLVNREIAHWIRDVDLHVANRNVTAALAHCTIPLFVVLANRDGVVPPSTASCATDAWGGADTSTLVVGDDENWFAHANLFIADDAPRLVFEPLIAWLRARQMPSNAEALRASP
ncbi:MAG: alpha/beta fold hydrolase [Myxococcota bacterium]